MEKLTTRFEMNSLFEFYEGKIQESATIIVLHAFPCLLAPSSFPTLVETTKLNDEGNMYTRVVF